MGLKKKRRFFWIYKPNYNFLSQFKRKIWVEQNWTMRKIYYKNYTFEAVYGYNWVEKFKPLKSTSTYRILTARTNFKEIKIRGTNSINEKTPTKNHIFVFPQQAFTVTGVNHAGLVNLLVKKRPNTVKQAHIGVFVCYAIN